jgi:phage shock protein PspC (stress-responsive transcriptional regulator)
MTSDATNTNVFLRNDTIFGTCQAIGDEFGINPTWLRVPLAASVLISPTAAFLAYLGLSAIVLAARLIFRSKAVPAAVVEAPAALVALEANDDQRELIAA